MPTDTLAAEITYLQAVSAALRHEMRADPTVFLMGQDIAEFGGAFKGTVDFLAEFGVERVMNTPIAESGTLGMAVGAALLGRRPVVEMQFADFVTCGFNQIVNVAAKMYYRTEQAVPLVVRLPYGGGVGAGMFHSQSVEAWFLHVAGLKVVAPAWPADAYALLRAAIRDPNPVLFFEHKYLYRRVKGRLPERDGARAADRVPTGSRCVRPGKHATAVAWGWMVHRTLEAADLLAKEDILLEVLDLPTLAPLDLDGVVASVRRTGRIVIVHEAPLTGGFGGEIAARIASDAFASLDAPVHRVAYPDTPVPFHKNLEDPSLPSPERIADAVRDLVRW